MSDMNHEPLLSYIVLSYNYDQFIATTLRSILEQSEQDFEIVVVDDCSRDDSLAVIRSFDDRRIRLLINESNLGGAASYNRAVEAARGRWLVNLDADDWILPDKAAIQLNAITQNPEIDIIGTYVKVVDLDGRPHPAGQSAEAAVNQQHPLNLADTWINANWLCRSTTMVRRAAHLAIGLDDPNMVRAPDYELWTRALRAGCRFAVVPEALTMIRQHPGGVTHGDPLGTLLEMSYAMLRNLVPLAEARALHSTIQNILSSVVRHPRLSMLEPVQAYRLLGMFITPPELTGFQEFRNAVLGGRADDQLAKLGRFALGVFGDGAFYHDILGKLERDIALFLSARDFWHEQSENWKQACHALEQEAAQLIEAREFWHHQSDEWERRHHALVDQLATVQEQPVHL